MKSSPDGQNTIEIRNISCNGIFIVINEAYYFMDFKIFPYFKNIPLADLFDLEIDDAGDIRWDKYDIDLCEEIIQNPEKYPVIHTTVSVSEAGRIGGRSRSLKKRRASKLNGRLGGRPKKKEKVKA